ncbi:hypothetical protein EMIHUDRAFT_97821 [Emiliania huxleyi CCMP1516]|uniref:Uncharacterized protein n=2 Tax=Emiliania huxleyi TaxID=2903 RepID=A0A0D3KV60_EMIH1|nr:hypothetical protein EMIHUDRAFT_97821 [Emiliania huxleyi CCMP1516]EOD39645.1 hypothetical protein EMIHUDRAFT_97821 [Emiliania huxleyi CCMP1516]|eukprot:XP_005792074.1 hypothetical protein EMIHUDRAFT_97821 [Emiliania huxleyi CCMP1516]
MVAAAFLDRCFCVSERGSSVGTEVRAGITTFVTMAYILVVNPTIMATAGLPFKAAAFATAATAIVGSGFVSVFANLPFGLAPGMGLNAYFAYGVCIARDIPVGVALAIMCGVGLSFGILSALGACSLLQQVMPNNLKYATTVAIGVFQAFIGFRMVNLVVGNKDTLVTLGDILSTEVALSIGGTFLIGVLAVNRGAMLIGICASSCFSWLSGLHPLPEKFAEMPSAHSFWDQLDFAGCAERWQETLPIMLAMLFVCIFDTAGVQFGAGLQACFAGLVDEQTGQLPGTRAAFLGASLATGLGGILGTSPVIILNETCAGIAEGGKTGLTGLVVALLFLLSLPFLPIFAAVPLTATAPCCIIVGAFMMGPAGAMDWDDLRFSLPAFLTITVMPMTYSIANGVVAGLVAHFILNVFSVSNKLLSDPLVAEGQPIQPPKLSPHAPRVRLDDRVEAAERLIERAGSFNRSPSAGHWSPPGL